MIFSACLHAWYIAHFLTVLHSKALFYLYAFVFSCFFQSYFPVSACSCLPFLQVPFPPGNLPSWSVLRADWSPLSAASLTVYLSPLCPTPKESWRPPELEETRKWFSPGASKGEGPYWHLDFGPMILIWELWPPELRATKFAEIDISYQSLGSFVRSATGNEYSGQPSLWPKQSVMEGKAWVASPGSEKTALGPGLQKSGPSSWGWPGWSCACPLTLAPALPPMGGF